MSKNRGTSADTWNQQKAADQKKKASTKTQRELDAFLSQSPTRREMIGQISPIFTAANNHETALGYLVERGLEIRDGRAYLNMEDLNRFAEELKAKRENAPVLEPDILNP